MSISKKPLVIKLGGSIFCDKSTHKEVWASAMNDYADFLVSIYRQYEGDVLMITGGGSYGHAAVRDAGNKGNIELSCLTQVNMELKWLWHQLFMERGIQSFPIQLGSSAWIGDDGFLKTSKCVFKKFLDNNYLPVVSGDVFIDDKSQLKVIGSDHIAHIAFSIWDEPPVVCFLTDENGVLENPGNPSSQTIKTLNQHSNLSNSILPEQTADTSGGMQGKIDAMLALAQRGAHCYIVNSKHCLEDPTLITQLALGKNVQTPFTQVKWQRAESEIIR